MPLTSLTIAIDADPTVFLDSGIGVGARGLLEALATMCPEIAIHCYYSANAPMSGWLHGFMQRENVRVHFLRWSKRMRNFRELIGLPCLPAAALSNAAPILYLYARVPLPSRPAQYAFVHDLSSLKRRKFRSVPWHGSRISRNALRRCAAEGVTLIAVSRYTKSELEVYMRARAPKIVPIYWGLDEIWFRELSEQEIDAVLRRYSLCSPYFYWCGKVSARKNLGNLLRAYRLAAERMGHQTPDLVLIGDAEQCSPLVSRFSGGNRIAGNVRVLPHLPRKDLVAIVSAAAALVFPSWDEGFGFPVVEALARGTPIVVSETGALREVAGPLGLTCRPDDPSDISSQLVRVATDPKLKAHAATFGPKWARGFSYAEMCGRLVRVLRGVNI